MIYFCGYPVPYNFRLHGAMGVPPPDFVPCGEPATQGCAFCEKHGLALKAATSSHEIKYGVADSLANDTGHGPDRFIRYPDKQALPPPRWDPWWLLWALLGCLLLVAFYAPIHTWLQGHIKFIAGFLVGSVLEAVIAALCLWKKR